MKWICKYHHLHEISIYFFLLKFIDVQEILPSYLIMYTFDKKLKNLSKQARNSGFVFA